MKRTCLLLAAVLAACGAESTDPASSTPAPALAPAAPRANPAGSATDPAAHPAARVLTDYFDAGAALFREVGAVMDDAEDKKKFDHPRMRAALDRTYAAFERIDASLASMAADPSFSFEYCLACIERDWNLNGRIDERDKLLLQIEVDGTFEELPEGDPRRKPTFRFDVGDLHWARAMLAFQRAAIDIILAYKWEALDQIFLFDDDLPMPKVINIRLDTASRVTRARSLILAGLDHAERSRAAYLAETDDDREWVPSPKQKNHPVPLPMDQVMYDRWSAILGDVRRLVRGEEGLSMGELGALLDDDFTMVSGYLDIRRLFDKPAGFTLDFRVFDDETAERNPKAAVERVLRGLFGAAYKPAMKKSPLTGRFKQMSRELEQDENELERKLRYLLWLN